MRKVLFTTMAVVALTFITNAQVRFGVKAGTNFSNLKVSHADDGDENESGKSKVGLHGGGFVTIPLSASFSLQPEALLSMEGAKDKEEDATLNITYLNIPLLLQYNASGFFAETGPQLGLLLAANQKFGDDSEDVKKQMKSTALSWALGAGYRFVNGVGIGARYNLGLSHLLKGDDKEGKLTSNVFQLSLSYAFGSGVSLGK